MNVIELCFSGLDVAVTQTSMLLWNLIIYVWKKTYINHSWAMPQIFQNSLNIPYLAWLLHLGHVAFHQRYLIIIMLIHLRLILRHMRLLLRSLILAITWSWARKPPGYRNHASKPRPSPQYFLYCSAISWLITVFRFVYSLRLVVYKSWKPCW